MFNFPFFLGFGVLSFISSLLKGDSAKTAVKPISPAPNNLGNGSYLDGLLSSWVVRNIPQSEGMHNTAYTPNQQELARGQWTIGYGTSYLYTDDFRLFNNRGSNKVKRGDTLDSLKLRMGYSKLSNEDFALRLIRNHMYAIGGAYRVLANDFIKKGLLYNSKFKDAVQEWAYGSQSIVNYVLRNSHLMYEPLKSGNYLQVARAYLSLRFGYYYRLELWRSKDFSSWGVRFSWSVRAICTAMWVAGYDVTVKQMYASFYSKDRVARLRKLETYVKEKLGLTIDLVS